MVDSVLSTGLEGIKTGIANAQQAAQDIVNATTTTTTEVQQGTGGTESDSPAALVELSEAAINLKSAEQQVQASATVVKSADEILGTLLDIKA